jgi:hypothetical protein
MQDVLAADIMRMLERILVVGGGILAVYFAYRLFQIATLRDASDANFKTALVEFGLCRVAPAVFFAAFGAYVFYTALDKPVSLSSPADGLPILSAAEWDRLASSIDKLPRADRDDAKKLLATARARARQNATGSIERRPGTS